MHTIADALDYLSEHVELDDDYRAAVPDASALRVFALTIAEVLALDEFLRTGAPAVGTSDLDLAALYVTRTRIVETLDARAAVRARAGLC